MNKYLYPLMLSAAIVMIVSCTPKTPKDIVNEPDALVSHIDSTVKPGDDFFLFANGKWFKNNPIPNSEQQNGLWQLIQDTINAQVRNICESSAALTNRSEERRVGKECR